jgi:Winged helix domain, variant
MTAEAAPPASPAPLGASPSYVLARLSALEERVRALIAHRRSDDPSPDDPFRGLYLSDEHVDHLLANGSASRVIDWDDRPRLAALESEAEALEAGGTEIRLRDVSRRAGLQELDVDMLLIALAPDLDARFESPGVEPRPAWHSSWPGYPPGRPRPGPACPPTLR